MTMGNKGKGRQSGAFASKAMKAQFRSEWQTRLTEAEIERKRKVKTSKPVRERPKLRLTSLHRLIEERQHFDRLEDKTFRQKNSTSTLKRLQRATTPGAIVYHADSEFGRDVRHGNTLQSLCIRTLAPCLHKYLEALGKDTLRQYLSLLPGPALTELSVEISKTSGVTNDLLGLLNHAHVARLSVAAPRLDDKTDRHWNALTGVEALVPTRHFSNNQAFVKETWEDHCLEEDEADWQWQGCRRLERLELANLVEVDDSLGQLLESCSSLTHLSLSTSFSHESGPEIWRRLPNLLPHLRYFDVSGNEWVSENLLRKLFEDYNDRYPQVLQVRAAGCLAATSQYALELEYGHQFICS